MFRPLLEAVRHEASGEKALESIRELVAFHRVQASPGYDEAAAWLRERLATLPVEVQVEHAPGDGRTRFLGHLMPEGWDCRRAVATLIGGDGAREPLCDAEREALSLVLRSAPARGRFPLVAVPGGANPSDYDGVAVRGAVVLSDAPVHRVHDLAVLARGAAGLLSDGRRLLPPVRSSQDDLDSLAYTSFWWVEDEPRGWGFVVSPGTGERLRTRLAAGERLELEVEIESRRFATPIPLISARLRGRRPGEVLIVSHLCHPRPSANDNASGAAAALETLRTLAALRARGEWSEDARSVRVLWIPEFTGTFAWLGRDPERAGAIVAALNLDMVGENQALCGSTLLLEHPPCFSASFAEVLLGRIRREALDWVTSYSGPGHYSLTRVAEVPYGGGSDHAAFVDPVTGVPCPMLIQWPDRFYHSSFDTPDKSDAGSLAIAVRCAATYAGFLASASAAECEWLAGVIERDVRRRLLARAEPGEDGLRIERERLRHGRSLASIASLGTPIPDLATRRVALDDFIGRELPPANGPAALVGTEADERRPVRLQASALDAMRRRLTGYATLTPEERERLWAFERDLGDAALLEVAWFACDGHRSLAEITHLVRLETGRLETAAVAEFFDWTARLGLSGWVDDREGAWKSRGRATASR